MPQILVRIAVRLALCALATWLVYRQLGLIALPIAAPLFGVALARPLIDLVAAAHHSGKTLALQDVQGRHWSHRGRLLDIAQDDDGARWLLVADVRKMLPGLPRDEVLQRHYGERVATVEAAQGLRIRADALAEYLRKSTDAASLKFRTWLDREVLGGSRNPRRHTQSNAKV
jgi:hypothetical protein